MRKLVLVMCLLLVAAAVICLPFNGVVSGQHVIDNPAASLAPSQRDINVATLAVILGGLLVGYERVYSERNKAQKESRDPRRPPIHKA